MVARHDEFEETQSLGVGKCQAPIDRMEPRVAGWCRGHRERLVVLWLLLSVLFVLTTVKYRSDRALAGLESNYQAQLPGRLKVEEGSDFFRCDHSQVRTVICNMRGDIRMHMHKGRHSFVLYSKGPAKVEIVKPYTRKWEQSCMDKVLEVTLRSTLNSAPPACDFHHTAPGIVFSTGGYTGNTYHDFNDGLIPLFITSQHLHREVVFVITEFQDWWLSKYAEVVSEFSKHEIVNFNDTRVHCFGELEIGLHIHGELTVDPDRMPNRETIQHFRAHLSRAYTGTKIPLIRRRLTIIVRNGTRKILNLDGVRRTAEKLGFQVGLLMPDHTTELKHIFHLLNDTDVLLGVHGAGLTHILFMRPGTVLVQVIPLGTEWASEAYFGTPAVQLGLHYLPFKITPAESTLSEKYNASDPVLQHPEDVREKLGWGAVRAIFLKGQDVRPSLARMRKTLKKALAILERAA